MIFRYYIMIFFVIFCFPLLVPTLEADQIIDTVQIEDNQILNPLSKGPPNPLSGREIVISREGNCLACHNISSLEEPFQGNIGPSLDGIGRRYKEGEIRLKLVNPYYFNSDSLMPSCFRKEGLYRVRKKYTGKTILTAQQIEDVISWLVTLR